MKKIYTYLLISEIIAFGLIALSYLLMIFEGLPILGSISHVGGFILIVPPLITNFIFGYFPQEGAAMVEVIKLLIFDFIFYSVVFNIMILIIYNLKNSK